MTWQVVLEVLREAELDVLLLAGRYSLLDHGALPELLPLCLRAACASRWAGPSTRACSPPARAAAAWPRFNYAPAAREWLERTARIEAVCDSYGVPLRGGGAAVSAGASGHRHRAWSVRAARPSGRMRRRWRGIRFPLRSGATCAPPGLLPDAAPTPREHA